MPAPAADIRIVLRGTFAVLTGVVERAGHRRRIVAAVATLDSITGVEDELRPSTA